MPTTTRDVLPGRDVDLRLLREQLGVAKSSRSRVVLVQGEAGIGKSRLIEEALVSLPKTIAVRLGRAEELEQDRPFGLVASCLGLTRHSDDPECARIGRLLLGEDASGQAIPETREPRF